MKTNDIAKLITGYAAGDVAYDALVEGLDGNDEVADQVVEFVDNGQVAELLGFLALLTGEPIVDAVVDTARETPIIGTAVRAADTVIGGTARAARGAVRRTGKAAKGFLSQLNDDFNIFKD